MYLYKHICICGNIIRVKLTTYTQLCRGTYKDSVYQLVCVSERSIRARILCNPLAQLLVLTVLRVFKYSVLFAKLRMMGSECEIFYLTVTHKYVLSTILVQKSASFTTK